MDDITDFLDYTLAMVSNEKDIAYIVNELIGMEMDFCPPEIAHRVGSVLAEGVAKMNNPDSVEEEGAVGGSDGVSGAVSPKKVSARKCISFTCLLLYRASNITMHECES